MSKKVDKKFAIKKGVPIPDKPLLVAIRKMTNGDCIENLNNKDIKNARNFSWRSNVKITTRKMWNGTYNLWRVS